MQLDFMFLLNILNEGRIFFIDKSNSIQKLIKKKRIFFCKFSQTVYQF